MNVLSWISTRWQHDASGYTYEMSVIVTLQDVCLWIPNPRDFCCLKLSETNTLDSVHIHRSDEKNSKPFVHVRNHTTSRYSKGTVQQFYSEYICHGIPNTKRKKKILLHPKFFVSPSNLTFRPWGKKYDLRYMLVFSSFKFCTISDFR